MNIEDAMTAADAFFKSGIALQTKNLLDEAVVSFQNALRHNPNHFGANFYLGITLYNKRQLDEALSYLQKALQINQNCDEVFCCLGMIFREKGQLDKAVIYFQRALQLNPNSAWAYTNMGFVLQSKGQIDEAAAYFRKALQHNPNICNPNNNLGDLIQDRVQCQDTTTSHQKPQHMSILISVPVFNRGKIARLSLAQTRRYKAPDCHLQVYNDHSTEYDNSFLKPYADEVIQLPDKMGIYNLRWHQFREFLETDFDFIYMTDSDVIHDPQYISMLEILYEAGSGRLPVSLFNSIFTMQPKMILYLKNGMFLKTTAPGNSMFYDREMVKRIVAASDKADKTFDHIPWDNKAVEYLGLPWVTPELSYLEHFGANGINNDNYERDRAINPTGYLRERRESILKYLRHDIDLQINF